MSADAERLASAHLLDKCVNYHLQKASARHTCRNYSCVELVDAIAAALAASDAELALMAARADAAERARQDMLDQRRFLGIEPAEGPIVSMSEAQFAQRDAELAGWQNEHAKERQSAHLWMLTAAEQDDKIKARDADLARLRARIEALEGYVTATYIDREEGYQDAARQLTERDAELARLRELLRASEPLLRAWMSSSGDYNATTKHILALRAALLAPAAATQEAP